MSKLSIVLSGVIEKSNFDEWKTDLLEQIRSVKTELSTDSDFASATKHVKQFKAAEKNLKEAKKSALKQAAEISALFEAIDEVSAEARQARLKLDKQIKKRKQEIKDEFIQQGVDTITAFIKEQSPVFQSISHKNYTDDDIFADAVSGKASSKGMQKAITKTCDSIKEAITQKAAEVDANNATLDKLPGNHQALFQDRTQLIVMSPDDLNKTIDERVQNFKPEVAQVEEPELAEPEAEAVEEADEGEASEVDKSDYLITIEVSASEEEADAIRTTVVEALASNNAVGNITLSAA